jgi:MFS family permease
MLQSTYELLKAHGSLIVAGFLLVFFSVFGQSVFFGAYIPLIKEDLNLSNTTISFAYTLATISSSFIIIYTGKGLDRFQLRYFVCLVLVGLAAGCFVMAYAYNIIVLTLAFFILRQFGQGLMVLSAHTSINRYISKNKGKALALTSLGGSCMIIVFPIIALVAREYMGWRDAWIFYSLFILFILLPIFAFLLKSHQSKTHAQWEESINTDTHSETAINKHWSRVHVLQDWRFYALLSITILSPFIGTVIFFYQGELANALSMSPLAFAATFPTFTIASIVFSIVAGQVIDIYGEKPVLIIFPILYALGLYLLSSQLGIASVYSGMLLIGGSNGIISILGGPILTQLYGTKYLGSIKSMLFSSSILSSAISPLMFGFLIDQGYDITTLLSWGVYYAGTIWLVAIPISQNLREKENL